MQYHPELIPLEGGEYRLPGEGRSRRPLAARPASHYSAASCIKGPLRAVRLLLLITVVPALFILIPIYLRYRVFSGQMYPLGMTDMRLIDNKISTTWCQRQVVRSNATFNAFLLSEQPQISSDLVPVSMTRYLTLEDDMKEYWGFYLLKGSVVTVSTCVRWPGASLTMIKGHKHLQDCAYIGDDSSEELEELLEANERGLLANETLLERLRILLNQDSPANDPDAMKRHKSGVSFHDPSRAASKPNTMVEHEVAPAADSPDVTDHDPQELRAILERLHSLKRSGGMHDKSDSSSDEDYRPPAHLMALPALHRHRDTNVDREERQWISFKDLDGNSSIADANNDIMYDDNATISVPGNKQPHTKENKYYNRTNENKLHDDVQTIKDYVTEDTEVESHPNIKDTKLKDASRNITHNVKENRLEDTANAEDKNVLDANQLNAEDKTPSSVEVYEDIVSRLESLGGKGRRVLQRLSEIMKRNDEANGTNYYPKEKSPTTVGSRRREVLDESAADVKLDELRKVLAEALDEEARKNELAQKRREANAQARAKRELLIQQAEFQKSLNEDDEARNSALEEGLEPDGYAEDHHVVNETTANDMSNSEFWSSFSSSEEALLECEGLVLNLPLTPHPACGRRATDAMHSRAAEHNAVTYRVPGNGYYFFVFNSENEVQENFIRVKFDLQKTMYDIAHKTLLECRNFTEKCELPLNFFSGQKVVLEVPLRDNDSLWNEEFVVISECEPRTAVYLVCVIAVPLLVVIFAFQ